MKQENREVTKYYIEMVGFWQELDLSYEEQWEGTNDSVRYMKKSESERTKNFLLA